MLALRKQTIICLFECLQEALLRNLSAESEKAWKQTYFLKLLGMLNLGGYKKNMGGGEGGGGAEPSIKYIIYQESAIGEQILFICKYLQLAAKPVCKYLQLAAKPVTKGPCPLYACPLPWGVDCTVLVYNVFTVIHSLCAGVRTF